MTKNELNAIKARVGALSPAHLQKLRGLSENFYNLVTRDIPALIAVVEEIDNRKSAERRAHTGVEL